MNPTGTTKVSFDMMYKPIPTGLLGKCVQFPFIVIKAKNLKELQTEMVDAIKIYLKEYPEQVRLLMNPADVQPKPGAHSLVSTASKWQETRVPNVITVRR